MELKHQCMDYALQTEIERVDEDIDKTRNMLTKFVQKVDYNERFRKIETELYEQLNSKLETKIFERKIEHFENKEEKNKIQYSKELSSLREVNDRMRRKTEETTHSMIEIRSETDTKLSAKEGQKLWANFRKYAQYDELKDLYRKTMPAIS